MSLTSTTDPSASSSISKIWAPGLRIGWITSSPAFQEHLVKFINLSTLHPSGLAQVLLAQLLSPTGGGWAPGGFDRWALSLRRELQRRRDRFLALFAREVAATGLASADAPTAGLFVWVRVHVERHPRFVRAAAGGGGWFGGGAKRAARTNTPQLMRELFDACVAAGLLVCPASYFVVSAEPEDSTGIEDVSAASSILPCRMEMLSVRLQRTNYLRTTFSGPEEAVDKGLPILGRVLQEFFADSEKGPNVGGLTGEAVKAGDRGSGSASRGYGCVVA